jgi:type I restriction enzyme M protein
MGFVLALPWTNWKEKKQTKPLWKEKNIKYILDEQFRWPNWAMPKTADGKLDHHKAITGPDLVQFVDYKLFPYLAGFKAEIH